MTNYTDDGPINPDVVGVPLSYAEDAIAAVHYAWDDFATATTETKRAQAITDLSNAISDLSPWHSMYDYQSGCIVDPDAGEN